MTAARALGLLLGVAADGVFTRAGFGKRLVRSSLTRQLTNSLPSVVAVSPRVRSELVAVTSLLAGVLAEKGIQKRPVLQTLVTAATTWSVLGAANLIEEGTRFSRQLEKEDFTSARKTLAQVEMSSLSLVTKESATAFDVSTSDFNANDFNTGGANAISRNKEASAARLEVIGLSRAGIETVARETVDVVVSPLLYGAVAGIPGLIFSQMVISRDISSLDRVREKLLEIARFLPTRFASLLTVVSAPIVGGSSEAARQAWKRDVIAHPQPNTASVQASFAGALQVRIGGRTEHSYGVVESSVLGDGRNPDAGHVIRAVELSRLVGWFAGMTSAVLALIFRLPTRGKPKKYLLC